MNRNDFIVNAGKYMALCLATKAKDKVLRNKPEVFEDPTLHRMRRAGWYAYVSDNEGMDYGIAFDIPLRKLDVDDVVKKDYVLNMQEQKNMAIEMSKVVQTIFHDKNFDNIEVLPEFLELIRETKDTKCLYCGAPHKDLEIKQ